MKVSIVGSLRDRDVACSASDRQGSNFKSFVWRTVSSQSSHHPQEVLLAQFSLYVHKGGLKPDSFHLDVHKLSPLEKTELGTALIHHIHGKLSWSSLVIIYMCKKVSEYPSHSFTYLPIYIHPPPPPVIYIINTFLK